MVFTIIIIGIFCFAGGFFVQYKINQRHNIPIIQSNELTAAHNEELRKKEQELTLLIKAQNDSLLAGMKELNELDSKITALKLEEVTQKQNIQESMNREADRLSEWITEQRNSYEQEYLKTMKACIAEFNKIVSTREKKVAELNAQLLEAEQRQAALVAEHIKNYHDTEQINLYTLHIPKESIKDIKKLREVADLISDASILNKLIWKQYYEKAFTDLIGRTIGATDKVCGVYKITNLSNGKVYIGQSVDVRERLRTHMKRGVGAEPITQNKLYPAMYNEGIENFSYELIEQCSREDLDKEEKYWIKFYKAQEFGYNETKGNG